MTEDEIKTAIAEAVKTETAGLKNTISKLKEEKATLKDERDAAVADKDTLSAAAADKSGDLDSIRTAHTKALSDLQKKLDAKDTLLTATLIDGAISKAIADAGVAPHFVKAVSVMLKDGAKLDSNGVALGADGEPIADYAKSFLTGEEGRHFVSAPVNTGAGATGSTAKAADWAAPPQTGEEIDRWMKYTVSHPGPAAALADKWARPELRPA